MVLAKKSYQPEGYSGRKNVSFLVIDLNHGEILLEDEVSNGSVDWHNATQILISQQHGNPKPNDSQGLTYLYDVIEKKKVKMGGSEANR